MQRRYKAFISYSWADKRWANWLHRTLELYRTPKDLIGQQTAFGPVPRSMPPIFKDREEESAGGGIGAAIEAALEASQCLIVLCSPRSAQSQWVNREVAWFKVHKPDAPILALVIDGEPGASLSQNPAGAECFPKTLLFEVDQDLQPTTTLEDPPLAADARKSGDGRRLAKLKLVAALLGVGLDNLVRRDDRRKAVRRRWVMSGLSAITLAMAGLTFVALNQRDQARIAQTRAEEAQSEAEFQRDEAQKLVEFMLTDLRDRLDAVGRLDVLEAVGTRALDFYGNQDPERLDPDALGRRARAQLLLGEIDNGRGDLTAALIAYEAAAETTAEQLRRAPDSGQQIYDHAQSVFWVGYIAWQRGDIEKAQTYFNQYYDLSARLAALDPENTDWRNELIYAHSNLGTLAIDQGDPAAAEAQFAEALDLVIGLVGEKPETLQAVMDLGDAYSWLAEALELQLKLEAAHEARVAEISTYTHGLDNSPGHAGVMMRLVIGKLSHAQLHLALGRFDDALASAKAAVAIGEDLLQRDPANTVYGERAGIARMTLAEAHFYRGDVDDAYSEAQKSFVIAKGLRDSENWTAEVRGFQPSEPLLLIAKISEQKEDPDAALAIFASVRDTLSEAMNEASTPNLRRLYVQALAGLARRGEGEDSSAAWREVLSVGEGFAAPALTTRMVLTEAQFRLGRLAPARDLYRELHAAGVQHPEFTQIRNWAPVDVADAQD